MRLSALKESKNPAQNSSRASLTIDPGNISSGSDRQIAAPRKSNRVSPLDTLASRVLHPGRRFTMAFDFKTIAVMAFNFFSSIGIIFINKAVFKTFGFRYATFYTSLHFFGTMIGLWVCRCCGLYKLWCSRQSTKTFVADKISSTTKKS